MVGMARALRAKHAANAAPKIEVNMLQLMFRGAGYSNSKQDEVAMGMQKDQLRAEMQSNGTESKCGREIKMQ
jgi:hypothetical protein